MRNVLLPKKIKFNSYKVSSNIRLDLQIQVGNDFTLHDGPPFANGDLHIGHGVNKVSKDIINRIKILYGYRINYKPGWDCHGLPIENAVPKSDDNNDQYITKCKAHASMYIERQKKTFQRLGIVADWNNIYTTHSNDYEYSLVEIMYSLAEKGYIKNGKMPIMWSISERTSLSDAEIEYKDKISKSIYILFPTDSANILVWTTTPWTIPANKAICFNKDIKYVCIKSSSGKKMWVSEALLKNIKDKIEFDSIIDGEEFPSHAYHPISGERVLLFHGDHVTNEVGTGFVHTAPAHGIEDFKVALEHNLDIPDIVDEAGNFTEGKLKGLNIEDCFDELKRLSNGCIIYEEDYLHSYPHSWRSKKPLIYRISNQWFFDLDHNNLREKSIKALDNNVNFFPRESSNRMIAMLSSRPHWCLSRQRKYGTPMAFYTKEDGSIDLTRKEEALSIIKNGGIEAWSQIEERNKVNDIVDVWFESACSNIIVNKGKKSDVYYEGSDQHRGWFQSSLIVSAAVNGDAPYKNLLTHGFVVSGDGEKLSKSKGAQSLDEILDKYGVDTFRILVSSTDVIGHDICVDNSMFDTASKTLFKIRNTMLFLLGNVVESEEDNDIDYEIIERYILHKIYSLNETIKDYIDRYEMHLIFRSLTQFITEISSFYFEIRKDTLYCDSIDNNIRRSCISVLRILLNNLSLWFSVFIPYSMEEVFSIFRISDKLRIKNEWRDDDLFIEFNKVLEERIKIMKMIEDKRETKEIGSSLEAYVEYNNKNGIELLNNEEFMSQIIIAKYKLSERDFVSKCPGEKCIRCWKYIENPISTEEGYLCKRCS